MKTTLKALLVGALAAGVSAALNAFTGSGEQLTTHALAHDGALFLVAVVAYLAKSPMVQP